jgi:hypothetical protein
MVYVYINSDHSSPALQSEGRSGLEDDNVDGELSAEGDWEARVERLAQFLRGWGLPDDTELVILPPDWEPRMESRRVQLFPGPRFS